MLIPLFPHKDLDLIGPVAVLELVKLESDNTCFAGLFNWLLENLPVRARSLRSFRALHLTPIIVYSNEVWLMVRKGIYAVCGRLIHLPCECMRAWLAALCERQWLFALRMPAWSMCLLLRLWFDSTAYVCRC